jgi:hypothetical protein
MPYRSQNSVTLYRALSNSSTKRARSSIGVVSSQGIELLLRSPIVPHYETVTHVNGLSVTHVSGLYRQGSANEANDKTNKLFTVTTSGPPDLNPKGVPPALPGWQ